MNQPMITSGLEEPVRPSFTIGVTGNLDLIFPDGFSEADLTSRLETIFLFLRYGWAGRDPRENRPRENRLSLGEGVFSKLVASPEVNLSGLEKWPGVGEETELVLLSSLAPGADTFAVDVFLGLREQFKDFKGRVRAPLPFPKEIFEKSTSFDWRDASPDETAARVKKFRALVDGLQPDDVFETYLKDDVETGKALERAVDFTPIFKADLTTGRRHLRYQASGEYVAVFSDLLIAIYDDRFSSGQAAGSNAVVETKRRGATVDLLPMTAAFTWSDNGPIFHLFQPRHKAAELGPLAKDSERARNPVRILHPYGLGPVDDETSASLADLWSVPTDAKALKAYLAWQKQGNELITRIATSLHHFNATAKPGKREDVSLYDLCGLPLKDSQDNAKSVETLRGELEAKIGLPGVEYAEKCAKPFSDVRRRASDFSRQRTASTRKTHSTLFWLTFTAAVILHVFAHWHSLDHDHDFLEWRHARAVPGEHAAPAPSAESGSGIFDHAHPAIRPALGLSTAVLAILGLMFFLRHVVNRVEEESHDLRALAEGLRVQFYWRLAGLRRSVASNYMQRVRSEMDWIRNSISSLTFPSEQRQRDFLKLPDRVQLNIFRTVVEAWVSPPILTPETPIPPKSHPSQLHFFRREEAKSRQQLHALHSGGSIIALAGVGHLFALIIFTVLAAPFSYGAEFIFDIRADWSWTWWLAAGLTLLFVAAICQAATNPHERPHRIFSKLCVCNFPEFFAHMFHRHRKARGELSRSARLCRGICNFLRLLPASLGLAIIGVSLDFLLSQISPKLPGPLEIGIILMGICLLGGALMIAYAEKCLLSETAYSYEAAGELFAGARIRLETYLREMDAAISDNKPDEIFRTRERIHDLLFTLGKEALDENSEWLILRRARPIEPVLAG